MYIVLRIYFFGNMLNWVRKLEYLYMFYLKLIVIVDIWFLLKGLCLVVVVIICIFDFCNILYDY